MCVWIKIFVDPLFLPLLEFCLGLGLGTGRISSNVTTAELIGVVTMWEPVGSVFDEVLGIADNGRLVGFVTVFGLGRLVTSDGRKSISVKMCLLNGYISATENPDIMLAWGNANEKAILTMPGISLDCHR